MSVDANNLPDNGVDTSALTSLLGKGKGEAIPKSQKQKTKNQTVKSPPRQSSDTNKTKQKNKVKSPFDSPSDEELARVKEKLTNNISKGSLSPTRLAQLQILSSLSDSEGLIRKSQKDMASALGFQDRKGVAKLLKFFLEKGKLKLVKPFNSKEQCPAVYKVI